MTYEQLSRALYERLAIPKLDAGKALGWGRRTTEAAVASGDMPVIAGPNGKDTVPCWWVRAKLGLGNTPPQPEAGVS
jgi:hypothetical protein